MTVFALNGCKLHFVICHNRTFVARDRVDILLSAVRASESS